MYKINIDTFLDKTNKLEYSMLDFYSRRNTDLIPVDKMYETYYIKQKNKSRAITAPNEELKHLQKNMLYIFKTALYQLDKKEEYTVLNKKIIYQLGSNSYGFEKGKNIIMNAKLHENSNYFYKTDISHFFSSFDFNMTYQTIKYAFQLVSQFLLEEIHKLKNEKHTNDFLKFHMHIDLNKKLNLFNKNEKFLNSVLGILVYKKSLPTGSPVSPLIATLYMRKFDRNVFLWTKKQEINYNKHLIYSRYADDIVISSKSPFDFSYVDDFISNLLKKYKLEKNKDKTVFQTNKTKNVITGINVTYDGRITIGKSKKNELKKMLYSYLVKNESIYSIHKIKGNIHYIFDVEPEYCNKMINKYISLASSSPLPNYERIKIFKNIL